MNMEYVPSVAEWYAGKCVLITGATGFMGKVLVEKLLRDCPDIKTMYLLVRTKKGVEPSQRKDEYINHLVFDNIRRNMPKQLDKIKTIKGDVTADELGLDENDRKEIIDKVNIIFHCAANVRFDQPLREAVNMNLLGTRRLLNLATEIRNLEVFLHVSTAYCQCNEDVLEERGYEAPHSPMGIAQITQLVDDEVLEYLTPKLLKGLPNTYAYTKALTEDLVTSYDGKIPICITRPSIVTAAWNEPLPGWVEGMNGPTGLMVGAARGVIRSMHCNPDFPADVIPVDITINGMIVAAWDRGLKNSKTIDYVNLTLTQNENIMTWGQSVELGKQFFYKNPLCFSLWYPDGSIKSNYWTHFLCVVFFHYLPAYFIDGLLVLFRKKPFLVQVQKRVSIGLKVLQYYTTKIWVFKNDNFVGLYIKLSPADRKRFNINTDNINWEEYIGQYILGARQYLLKEKPETLPQARKLLRRLYILDRLVSILFYGLLAWLLYSYWSTIVYGFDTVFEVTKDMFTNRNSRSMRSIA